MTGDVMGKPVVYDMLAGPTLAGAFTEIHMIDAKQPPEYEARVFIGYDDESDSIIAHWMDSFGARYSIPHGTGTLTADTIRFVVPYADGPFRDTLIYDEKGGAWQFVIEASQGDGSWKHFARYSVQPTDGRR
ncbi:MAG TPA: hypothetical protein ENK10_03275 [Acidobacteria bacterium]|nr:hypothetical protein [Acidobacteriota bacterium]